MGWAPFRQAQADLCHRGAMHLLPSQPPWSLKRPSACRAAQNSEATTLTHSAPHVRRSSRTRARHQTKTEPSNRRSRDSEWSLSSLSGENNVSILPYSYCTHTHTGRPAHPTSFVRPSKQPPRVSASLRFSFATARLPPLRTQSAVLAPLGTPLHAHSRLRRPVRL